MDQFYISVYKTWTDLKFHLVQEAEELLEANTFSCFMSEKEIDVHYSVTYLKHDPSHSSIASIIIVHLQVPIGNRTPS
jgi:hypothetical protein